MTAIRASRATLAVSAAGGKMTPQDLSQLTHLRHTFEELAEAYEAGTKKVGTKEMGSAILGALQKLA